MEFFNKTKAVKLRSHLDKYLVADDDHETVRQSRSGGSLRKARWLVELVEEKSHVIRLKSCHGRYLTASDIPFLLGMTGKRVIQSVSDSKSEPSIEWEPIRDGFQVKLRTRAGKYMRANGGTAPWRNSITHDNPQTSGTKDWVLWDVEEVEIPESDEFKDYLTSISSFSSVADELLGSEPASPISVFSNKSPSFSPKKFFSEKSQSFSPTKFFTEKSQSFSRKKFLSTKSPSFTPKKSGMDLSSDFQTGMDLFHNAKAVRLRSHLGKYLLAEEDEESVTQDRHGSSKNARWTIELVPNTPNVIRLKSCYNKYLTASNQPFLLGMTGCKVFQTQPPRLDSSVEWEPVREGNQVKLKTRYGQFLRANGGLPPWRNSVTHDIPHRTATQDWVIWGVDIVEIQVQSPGHKPPVFNSDSLASDSSSPSSVSIKSATFSRQESTDSSVSSPPKMVDGRMIYFHVADEDGRVDDAVEEYSFAFKGNGVDELTHRLEEETGLEDIIVCSRSTLNGKLYPLRLQLPPNNTTMHVVVLQSSSKGARDFAKSGIPL